MHRGQNKRSKKQDESSENQQEKAQGTQHNSHKTPLWAKSKPVQRQSLTVNQANDSHEREAEQVANQVMRSSEVKVQRENKNSAGGQTAPDSVHQTLQQSGQSLDSHTQQFMESRFNTDFSDVRIHTDNQAAQSAADVDAAAYTVGNDIVFGEGHYQPQSTEGKRLIAHELSHTLQQGENKPSVQRDLKAYNKAKTETLMASGGMGGGSTSYIEMTAEAPGIRKALSALIAAGKVKEVKSKSGDVSWFAAQHHKNAQLDEIKKALSDAGYSNADKLARAIYDIHGEYLYSSQKLTTVAAFYSNTTDLGEKIETQTNRSMTEWEIRQAKRVFGSALDYTKVTISDGSISSKIGSAGGYARTIGNTIYFPTGGSRIMAFMVHELTHVWQYQTTGWTYAPKAIWAQMTEGYGYADGGSAEQALIDARKAGKTLYSYNKEQQGDILRDYYRRLQKGKDTSAWQPFVNDIHSK